MEDNEPVEPTTPTPEPELPLPVEVPAAEPAPSPEPDDAPAAEEPAPESIVSEAVAPPAPAESTPEPEAADPAAPEAKPAAELPAWDAAALGALADQSATQRLPAPEEERAVQLVRVGLLASKEEVAAVAAVMPRLGWAVAVKGVTAAWPEMKATARTSFLKALTADESEAGRRIRLSLARGLFKIPDAAAGTKLALGVCKEIRDKKTGEVPAREAQNFANVLIGKGKPWIALMPLTDLKPADAAMIVHCAIIAAFSVNGPPVTPVGVLRWAGEAGQLAELHETALATVVKGVAKWSPKWAEILRREVPAAPEAILAALKPATPVPAPTSEETGTAPEDRARGTSRETDAEDDDDEEEDEDDGLPPELKDDEGSADEDSGKRKERPVYVSKTVPPRDGRASQVQPQQAGTARESQPRESQPREPKGPPAKSPQFNATEALRQIESHIGWLKNELQFAEKKLRSREDESRKPRKPDVPVIPGEPTPEELARYNVQLEARITELQARIDDLTIDSEARATSAGAFTGEQPAPDIQLRTLLGLKLADAYADFEALGKEDRALVVPQHYRTVLTEVFAVLKAEGIVFAPPPQPAE